MTQQVESGGVPTRAVVRIVLLVAAVVLLIQVGLSLWAWSVIPAGTQIPTHWGVDGKPDGWSGKEFGLWFGPGMTVLLAMLFVFVPRIEPRRAHLASSSKAYGLVVGSILVLLGAVHVTAVLAATGTPVAVGRIVPFAVGLLLGVIGAAMMRIKSNFFFGVRTPWTLNSELSWARTHLVTGWLWVILGAALAALALFDVTGTVLFGVLIGGIVVTLVVAYVYSYLVWSRDPDRQRLGR